MTQIQTTEKRNSQLVSLRFVAAMMIALVGFLMIFATPVIGEFPVEITEDLEILAVTEKGVVFETSTGVAVVTNQYEGEPGDVIEVTYSVPVKYLEDKRKLQVSVDAFPDP